MIAQDRMVIGEGTLNHYWSMCFADEQQRNGLGLKYISQMWDASPYWYLWFVDRPGVYKMSLQQCTEAVDWDWRAFFRISYYPRPEEEAFKGLSMLEQICRMSEAFHTQPAKWEEHHTGCVCHGGIEHHGERFADLRQETGVPRAEIAQDIPEEFFWVGTMEWFVSDHEGSKIIWDSQDHWRVRMTENYYICDGEGAPLKVLRKGDVDRDYPGWSLTDFFVRRFIKGWRQYMQYDKIHEAMNEQDGMEFLCDGAGLNAATCADIRRRTAWCQMTC